MAILESVELELRNDRHVVREPWIGYLHPRATLRVQLALLAQSGVLSVSSIKAKSRASLSGRGGVVISAAPLLALPGPGVTISGPGVVRPSPRAGVPNLLAYTNNRRTTA